MISPEELAAFRATTARRRPHNGHVYWVDMVGGPLDGLRVALPMATAEDLRHHNKTATIDFCIATRTGYVAAVYRPAGRRRLVFVEWSQPDRAASFEGLR